VTHIASYDDLAPRASLQPVPGGAALSLAWDL
jgi:hypothetical protein